MQVLLLFPPHCLPYQPWMALPTLKAYLQANGIEVGQRDLNIELYHRLLGREYLDVQRGRLLAAVSRLEAKDALDATAQKRLLDMVRALARSDGLAARLPKAIAAFRDPHRFYDFPTLRAASEDIERAFDLIAQVHHPAQIAYDGFALADAHANMASLIRCTSDPEVNPFLGLFAQHAIPSILERQPRVVGISLCLQEQIIPGLTLSRMVMAALPATAVVLGGYAVTKVARRLKKEPEFFRRFAHYVVLEEGERPLLGLVRAIESGADVDSVPGVVWRDGDRVRVNEPPEPLPGAELPGPDYCGLPLDLYWSPTPVLSVASSRGCYWGKCAFCDRGEASGIRYRPRPTEAIADDLERLSRAHGATHFTFTDEAIAPSAVRKLADEILSRGLDLRLSADLRFEAAVTPELCLKMARAGFVHIRFGLESASDRVLGHMRKGTDRQTIRAVLENVARQKLCAHLYVFFGFPTESEEEAAETIDFIVDNEPLVSSACCSTFGLLDRSPAYVEPDRFGIGDVSTAPGQLFKYFFDFRDRSNPRAEKAAKEKETSFLAAMARTYEDHAILGYLEWSHQFLYCVKYGFKGIRETARAVRDGRAGHATVAVADTISGPGVRDEGLDRFVPVLGEETRFFDSEFDLSEIAENVERGSERSVARRRSHLLFDGNRSRFLTLNDHAAAVVALIDGSRTVADVVHCLADLHGGPPRDAEREVGRFLQQLSQMGIVNKSREG